MAKKKIEKKNEAPQLHIRLGETDFGNLRIMAQRKGLTANMQAKSLLVEILRQEV